MLMFKCLFDAETLRKSVGAQAACISGGHRKLELQAPVRWEQRLPFDQVFCGLYFTSALTPKPADIITAIHTSLAINPKLVVCLPYAASRPAHSQRHTRGAELHAPKRGATTIVRYGLSRISNMSSAFPSFGYCTAKLWRGAKCIDFRPLIEPNESLLRNADSESAVL